MQFPLVVQLTISISQPFQTNLSVIHLSVNTEKVWHKAYKLVLNMPNQTNQLRGKIFVATYLEA